MSEQIEFYTHVAVRGDDILYRGYKNGYRIAECISFIPTLYLPDDKDSAAGERWSTIDGQPLKEIHPGSIRDCREFVKSYEGVSNFRIYGNTDYAYQYINREYPDVADYDPNLIRIATVDIETECEKGFSPPEEAAERINVITFHLKGIFRTFALGNPKVDLPDCIISTFDNEEEMLLAFREAWEAADVDIVTGWNVEFYDIPYLVNRYRKLFGDDGANWLSPWGYIREKQVATKTGQMQDTFDLNGIAVMDYLRMYQKFTFVTRESYKLDFIAEVELGEKKLSYEEYPTFKDFYQQNFSKFVEYNIHDVALVAKLEKKLKLMEMVVTMTYMAKVNFTDVYSPVRTWDQLIYHHLSHQKVAIPMKESHSKEDQFAGAYVKEPIPGGYNWVVSFDLNSLYPHLIMQSNVSPEMMVGKAPKDLWTIDDLINDTLSPKAEAFLAKAKEKNVSVAANGVIALRDKQGFLPFLMEKLYQDRKTNKKKMLAAKQLMEETKEALKASPNDEALLAAKTRHEFDISKYHNFQLAGKVFLNSGYGALGNRFFRFYDIDMAEAITLGGQLAIRWVGKALNNYLNKVLKNTEPKDYVIASDTDSVYLNLGELVDRVMKPGTPTEKIIDFLDRACKEQISKVIDESFVKLAERMNSFQNRMVMEREVIASRGIWTKKKRYALNVHDSEGVRYTSPKMKIMGIETTRSSTPAICRAALEKCIFIAMNGTEEELHAHVASFKDTFMAASVEEVAFPRSVKGLKKWADPKTIWASGTPAQVKAALIYNKMLVDRKLDKVVRSIGEGEKIKFAYVKSPNPYGIDVIGFPGTLPKALEVSRYVDYNRQYEVAFSSPLEKITEVIGWTIERKYTLESLFE